MIKGLIFRLIPSTHLTSLISSLSLVLKITLIDSSSLMNRKDGGLLKSFGDGLGQEGVYC